VIAPAGTPHIWIHGAGPALTPADRALLATLRARHPRYRLLLTSGDAAVRTWLRREFPDDTVREPPRGGDWRVRRALGRLRPHALVLLERPDDLGRAVFERARWWRFPVLLLGGHAADLRTTPAQLLEAVDHFVVDAEATRVLESRGVPPERISRAGASAETEPAGGDGASDPRLPALLPLLSLAWAAGGTPPPRGRGTGWLYRWLDARPAQRVLRAGTRRLDSLDAVRAALGPCETILCLGNGPSSEDPRLAGLPFDALFRVNCSWRHRGALTRPHVVFLGDRECLDRVQGCVFAFRTQEEEARFLADRLRHGRLRPLRYLTVERLPVFINERRWPARPTNGAVMIATAAALAPARLVIAGMDLFQHPAGAYPGDPATPNDYLLMHDRETELAIVEEALGRFGGAVTVLSEPLARGLERRRAAEGERAR
jgi:hypothetical protein